MKPRQQSGVRVALSSQEAPSRVWRAAPALSEAGFLSSYVGLGRGEDTPMDTKWTQRQGADGQLEPAV